MASKQSGGGMDISVHPLVILSIADHYTRNVQQYKVKRAIGALFGVQTGRTVHVYDTFEIGFKDEEKTGKVLLDHEHLKEDLALYAEAYPNYECLGWYSTGDVPRADDSLLHEEMTAYNDRPLFLVLNPAFTDGKELPVAIYEEDVHVVDDKSIKEFVKTSFKIHSDEAERISAVHCAKVVVGEHVGSSITPHFKTLHKSVATLRERVQVLHTFLRDVSQGKIEADHNLLRAIRGVCNRLPTMDSPQFDDDFVNEYNDALMITYLASCTKSAESINSVVDKFNTAFASSGRGRGGPGMGMGRRQRDGGMMAQMLGGFGGMFS